MNKTSKELNKRKVYVAVLAKRQGLGGRLSPAKMYHRSLRPASSCPSFWWNAWHALHYGCRREERWAGEMQTLGPWDAQPSLLLDACGACQNQPATCQPASARLQNLENVAQKLIHGSSLAEMGLYQNNLCQTEKKSVFCCWGNVIEEIRLDNSMCFYYYYFV